MTIDIGSNIKEVLLLTAKLTATLCVIYFFFKHGLQHYFDPRYKKNIEIKNKTVNEIQQSLIELNKELYTINEKIKELEESEKG